MRPAGQFRGGKPKVINNVYTALLALAFCAILATAAFVAFKCYTQYGTFFTLP